MSRSNTKTDTRRSPRLRSVVWLLALAVALPARACGPDFPNRLLDDRAAALQGLPEGTFLFESSRLLQVVPDALVEGSGAPDEPPRGHDAASLAYAHAAESFHEGSFVAARAGFSALLARPPEQQGDRGLAARYSLARTLRVLEQGPAAELEFRRVREAVLAGAADPEGLGVASFGEEARLRLEAGDAAGAVRLYAEQAARGSIQGSTSLLFVARQLLDDADLRGKALGDALVQRLLAAYLYTRAGELDAGRIDALLDEIEAQAIVSFDGADRLAAAAYRQARYDLAATLAVRTDSALSWWVRAKLALRAGDTAGAREAYAKASQAFPQGENWADGVFYTDDYGYGPFRPRCRVEGEIAILALQRGDYVEALGFLYAGAEQYWEDAAYVAERVLTPDELKAFVDANVPAGTAATPAADDAWVSKPHVQRLRELLARRLLRAGRGDEAMAYFDDQGLAESARRYVDAMAASTRGGRIARAEALFTAASIARDQGMELLGFEGDPDYANYGGNYDLAPPGRYDDQFNWIPEPRKDIALPAGLAGADEATRLVASRAAPFERFHYRYVAADLASRAADLLPARSQAFAAVLCKATGWINARDHARGEALWLRYVREGAFVPWAGDFSYSCEAPDFPAAEKRLQFERMQALRHAVNVVGPWLLGFGVLVAIVVVLRRRRRALR